MKKAYITRYGAFGDHIHCTHIPEMLKKKLGYDYVAFEYNAKGYQIHKYNPFIDEHIRFEPMLNPINTYPDSFIHKRWKNIKKNGRFDIHINLQNSIEYGYIAMEDANEYYMSDETRRQMFGEYNYYDVTTRYCGKYDPRFLDPELLGATGTIYFDKKTETDIVEKVYADNFYGKFVIICNLSGTSKHKMFYNAEQIIKTFLSRHEDAVCITMGDKDCRDFIEFHGDRIINRASNDSAKYPFRQSILMTKYANMVIGCESGLMVASQTFQTPTVQLMTAASIKNHGGDLKNDYSLQSPARCSPCHKGPYDYIGCPKFDFLGKKYPICIKFSMNTILDRMEQVYNDYTGKRETVSGAAVSAVR